MATTTVNVKVALYDWCSHSWGIAAAEWSGKLSGGSDLIKAMQRWAGVTADGYLGPQTIRAMQRKLGTTVDGVISYPSAMVRALQEWCNKQ